MGISTAKPLIIGNPYVQEFEPEAKDPAPVQPTPVSYSPSPTQVPAEFQRLQASPPPLTAPYVPPGQSEIRICVSVEALVTYNQRNIMS